MYHVSGDVLGALVARVSGKSFGAFLRERIAEPLGTRRDTAFRVPPEKRDRLASVYMRNAKKDKLDLYDDASSSEWWTEPPFESGGGGLVSTADDYLAFCRMMMKGDSRVLSRASVELMARDHLTPEQREGSEMFFGTHSSWGLGMAVDIGRSEIYHNPGQFGWTGGFGTTAYTDPEEGMIGILMTQRMMESPDPPRVFTDFWTLAYAAME